MGFQGILYAINQIMHEVCRAQNYAFFYKRPAYHYIFR